MKILLLGDFSSAQHNLQLGLQELGHHVKLVSHQDGFKKIPTDLRLYRRSEYENRILGATKEILSQFKVSRSLRGYDIVQTAAHFFFHNRIDKYLFPKIFEYNDKKVMLHAACSVPYNRFVRTLKYAPCTTCKQLDLVNHACDHEKKNATEFEYSRYAMYDAIVSTHYEYFKAFEGTPFDNKSHFIPIPIKFSEISTPIATVPMKINVYYGEIRKGFKGGDIIERAIEKVKSSHYGNRFNFITSKKLPFNEYVKVMEETHVLIDQVNSYSYGVNALVGLSKGKIVLSGAEAEVLEFMGLSPEACPIVNIRPSVDDIYQKLIYLYDNRQTIPAMSQKAINFVKMFHNPITIAGRYIELYEKI